jgi:hypothetical protein
MPAAFVIGSDRFGINVTTLQLSIGSLMAGAIGGNVKGLCLKGDGEDVGGDFQDRLMCLDCQSKISLTDGTDIEFRSYAVQKIFAANFANL